MALADSGRAMGAVTKLLREHLIRRGFAVSVGPLLRAATDISTDTKLNLLLYQTDFDASLRNVSLLDEQPPPLWLVLRYLITAYDVDNLSDSADAHELLGRGLGALNELNYLRLDAALTPDVRAALENNPEPLKITFDDTPAELLSKFMQGNDDQYRLSVAFQVRPVMIVPDSPPSVSLLVGVDYTQAPPAVIGQDGIGLAVLPSLGPRLHTVSPAAFEPGAGFSLDGEDLHLSNLECLLGDVAVSITSQRPDRLGLRAEGAFSPPATEGPIAAGATISAGEHPLRLRQLMPNGRYRASNLLTARLLPVVATASLVAGNLDVSGQLLGTADDDVLVALYRNGDTVRIYDSPATSADQKHLSLSGINAEPPPSALSPGDYQVVVLVNGQQARTSPMVTLN